MTITASIVADSISDQGYRLTTMSLRYPRFVHAEFMTHRVFSRNASSSRAIPIERMIQDVIDDPAMPVAWGSNKPGMQAGEECTNTIEFLNIETGLYHSYSREETWLAARDYCVDIARALSKAGYHKQIVNRLLEPFGHISVVCTASEWDNFFALRCHPDADPTMRMLADAMRAAMDASEPQETTYHLPYLKKEDWNYLGDDFFTHMALISAARCARVSYLNHDGSNPDIEKDLALAKRLMESRHMSPFEHQARATDGDITALWGNLSGWDQFRKMIE